MQTIIESRFGVDKGTTSILMEEGVLEAVGGQLHKSDLQTLLTSRKAVAKKAAIPVRVPAPSPVSAPDAEPFDVMKIKPPLVAHTPEAAKEYLPDHPGVKIAHDPRRNRWQVVVPNETYNQQTWSKAFGEKTGLSELCALVWVLSKAWEIYLLQPDSGAQPGQV